MSDHLTRVLYEARTDRATLPALSLLPGRYACVADVEGRLSYDEAALDWLRPALRASDRGAWNLLLLGLARCLRQWERQGGEIDLCFVLLVEAVQKDVPLLCHVRQGLLNHQRTARREEERTGRYVHATTDARAVAHSTDGPILAETPRPPDPLLREQIKRGLARMPARRRQWVLARATGERPSEIAAREGVPLGRVTQQLRLAQHALTHQPHARGRSGITGETHATNL